MKAMVLSQLARLDQNPAPLELKSVPDPSPSQQDLLLEVTACGICHTELDEIEGRTPPESLPVILGHQAIGRVLARGERARQTEVGERVGVAWIHFACGTCKFCVRSEENLCPEFRATGRDVNGGYAELMIVPESFAHPIPESIPDSAAAPLLCAGAIGYRALRLTGLTDGGRLGLTGFGASGHLVLKMVRHRFPSSEVYVFARNEAEREFARELGAVWTGDSTDAPPTKLDAIIDTTPVWKPLVEALKNLEPGGRLVVNAIRKEDVDKEYLINLNYERHLWLEREIKSVANVTRKDVREFLTLAAEIGLEPEVEEFALAEANQALIELKRGRIRGAKVLKIR